MSADKNTTNKNIKEKGKKPAEIKCRRKTSRPPKVETFIFINILIGIFLLVSLIGVTMLFISNEATYFKNAFLIFSFILSASITLYIRKRLIASINFRDKMIERLETVIHNKTTNSQIHDKQIKHLIESTNVCPWNANLKQNSFTYIGPQIENITQIPLSKWTSPGFIINHIIREDRHILFNAFKELSHQSFITIEYRIVSDSGKTLWLRNSFCLANEKNKQNIQGFITEITEQKNVEFALRSARYAAEQASKTKSNFLASMSHELRTPLNSIIGFAEIMKQELFGSLGQEEYKEYSDNIYTSGKHLLDLINDILDYSKIEAGKFDVIKEPANLQDIIKSCVILLKERAHQKGITFSALSPENPMIVNVDIKRVKQILINLLTNAIKFTPNDGRVGLEYYMTDKGDLTLLIHDSGIGIKSEDLKTIFNTFHQVDAERNRNQEGTGLGLSISKSLIELHGGTIDIQSVYGNGTRIYLKFPKETIMECHPNDYIFKEENKKSA